MKRALLRLAAAIAVTLWTGLVGALAGLGCFYLHPAQYRSTARVVVGSESAPAVVAAARNPVTLSTAILVADLFHSERDDVPLSDLAKRLPFTVIATPANAGAVTSVDLALTYADPYGVQRALDSVVRHMVSEDPAPHSPGGAFVLDARSATSAVRTSGFEPGISLGIGFVAGILLYSLYVQLRYRPAVVASANGGGVNTDRMSRTISSRDVNRLSS
jgi:hypothetical protein